MHDLFESLPLGLTRDCQFGLGLPRTYRPIVQAVEALTDCREIALVAGGPAGVEGDTLSLPLEKAARREIDRIVARGRRAASSVVRNHAYNCAAQLLGRETVPYTRGRHPMVQALSDAAADQRPMDDAEIENFLATLELHAETLSVRRPEVLARLREDVELVALDVLLERYRGLLGEGHGEAVWQRFFSENPFILSFALGYPLILVQDQASVGGRKFSTSGAKVADFLTKNPVTDNVALIEIKKPSTRLLQSSEYRSGVYGPSAKLSGSVAQVLDQRYHLTSEFAQRQRESRTFDIESFSTRTCLIIGLTPATVGSGQVVRTVSRHTGRRRRSHL